jgi:hypothetical protein
MGNQMIFSGESMPKVETIHLHNAGAGDKIIPVPQYDTLHQLVMLAIFCNRGQSA